MVPASSQPLGPFEKNTLTPCWLLIEPYPCLGRSGQVGQCACWFICNHEPNTNSSYQALEQRLMGCRFWWDRRSFLWHHFPTSLASCFQWIGTGLAIFMFIGYLNVTYFHWFSLYWFLTFQIICKYLWNIYMKLFLVISKSSCVGFSIFEHLPNSFAISFDSSCSSTSVLLQDKK